MEDKLNIVKEILKKYNQEHLLYFYDELSEEQQNILIDQILNIDFEKMKNSNSKYKDIVFKLVNYIINKKLYDNKYELSEYIQKIKLY